ncbi:MAG: GH92 family glycosyl hydrolase [Acidobacteria bacterium]|nr:GH92 family glycosyl hydrolase [Acidobacteriota bacterium]
MKSFIGFKRFAAFRYLVLIAALTLAAGAQTVDYTRYVDPFIGTGGHGHTFPGATVPFGMVQLSPDTRGDDWDGSSGYHYSDSIIYGFSHTHLNGTGIPDYCDILLMPTVGEVNFDNFKSGFSHTNETATPGYYSVRLDNGVTAELTATERVGLHRYTFPQSDKANIVLDLKWRDRVLDSELKIVGNNRVEGYRRSASWAKDQIVYFVAEFSKPFTISKESIESISGPNGVENRKAAFYFKTKAGEQILVKVALSPVSIEGARKNLAAEIPGWDFEKVRQNAKTAWNRELSKIEVAGGTDAQMKNFYTALYHLNIQPNVFDDTDGNYRGLDKKTHNIADDQNPKSEIRNPKSHQYTVFSLWDTFRAAHPLYTIVDQRRTVEFINTFIRQYEQGGRLPVWELAGNETDTMIGYHAVPVIADAMAKDIKGFDYDKAFAAAKHSAELDHFGLKAYRKQGFVSMEDENESVSRTLEYAYDDYCIAQMAGVLYMATVHKAPVTGDDEDDHLKPTPRQTALGDDYMKYIRRAQNYKNLFDRQTGFMRPKQNGGFIAPFQPNEVTLHYTEGNAWVYTFFVPQDVSGLMELFGGRENFAKKLDGLFTTEDKLTGREQPDITGLIGQYAHGNEPSHAIAYLYDYAGEPWKTQRTVRKILDEFYKPAPDGLIGNEDCGQMSAWYILSALGFYEVNPSQPLYAFGTPIFREAKINLENGKTFTIKAPNVSDRNIYIKSARLNGYEQRKAYFTHENLMNGGTLEFEMTDAPVRDWFTEMPFSKILNDFPAVPAIEAPRIFRDRTEVRIAADPGLKIFYTLDGSEPDEKSAVYAKPLTLDKTTVLKAFVINQKGEKSPTVESRINRMPHDWTIRLLRKYNRQYTGGGDEALIDGIRGTVNYASGEWQGYQPDDLIAVIDLKKETEIHRVGGGFLQIARSWIWMPTHITFEISDDGENFTPVADLKTDVAPDDMEKRTRDFVQEIKPVKTRFVRVRAYNLGRIPAWHPGAGNDAFIFADELIIE